MASQRQNERGGRRPIAAFLAAWLGVLGGRSIGEAAAGAPPSGAPQGAQTPASRPLAAKAEELPPFHGPREWSDRVRWNQRLGFPPSLLPAALLVLDGDAVRAPSAHGPERAAALFALGAAQAQGERGRLESVARLGPMDERRAALLALGELGGSEALLTELARTGEPEVAAAAFFGLILLRSPALGSLGAELIGARAELTSEILALGAFAREPAASQPASALVDHYVDLRWRAARDLGRVDGKSWRVWLLEARLKDDSFVDDVVLPALARVRHPGTRDHLATLLLERPTAAVFGACVEVLPAELERMLARGVSPRPSPGAWARALDLLDERGPAGADQALLRLAMDVPEVALRACALALETGLVAALDPLVAELDQQDPVRRAYAARAIGAAEHEQRAPTLERLALDPDPRVRAAALVGRMRHGERRATEELRARLGEEGVDGAALIAELLEVRRAPRVRILLEELLPTFSGTMRLRAAMELCLPGRVGPRDALREALERGEAGSFAPRAIRLLADGANREDLELIARIFPATGPAYADPALARAVDAAAARALLEAQESSGMNFLRAALWSAPWHRSVLAGHLLASQGGVHALHEELESAPVSASSRDLRRIGFAIGSWGGPQQVEILARRRASSDPALQGAYLGALSSRTY